MTPTEFRALLLTLEPQIDPTSNPDAAQLLQSLSNALQRFDDRTLADLEKKIAALKPPAKKAAKTGAPRQKTPAKPIDEQALAALIDDYKASLGNNSLSSEVIARANKLLKPEAIVVASAIGMVAKKETTKKAAIDYLKAKAAECERDSAAAERIRLGA